jgi:hypothetical protein
MTASGPAKPLDCCSSRMAFTMISRPCPGTIVETLSIRLCVADGPSRPSNDVSTMIAGNKERTL